jgi:hypothetical protein
MSEQSDAELLDRIAKMLHAGLKTMSEPVPEDNFQVDAIVKELAGIPADDVEKKLVVSGYLNHPVEEMRCLECMYYLNHRKWCNLPEINLPAEPDWWCRLWRI